MRVNRRVPWPRARRADVPSWLPTTRWHPRGRGDLAQDVVVPQLRGARHDVADRPGIAVFRRRMADRYARPLPPRSSSSCGRAESSSRSSGRRRDRDPGRRQIGRQGIDRQDGLAVVVQERATAVPVLISSHSELLSNSVTRGGAPLPPLAYTCAMRANRSGTAGLVLVLGNPEARASDVPRAGCGRRDPAGVSPAIGGEQRLLAPVALTESRRGRSGAATANRQLPRPGIGMASDPGSGKSSVR
jgi:hypothetical protein